MSKRKADEDGKQSAKKYTSKISGMHTGKFGHSYAGLYMRHLCTLQYMRKGFYLWQWRQGGLSSSCQINYKENKKLKSSYETIQSFCKPSEVDHRRAVTRAEAFQCQLIANLNLSLSSADTLNKTLKLMFPDSKIAAGKVTNTKNFKSDGTYCAKSEDMDYVYTESHYSETKSPPFQRADQLQKVCSKVNDIGLVPTALPKNTYRYFYVNDKYKFIFCMMPKVACTNWKRVFLALSDSFPDKDFVMNKMKSSDVHGKFGGLGASFDRYSPNEIVERMDTYKKLIFVRDPFERLLSAFKDKMFRKDSRSFESIAKKVVRLKRNRTVNENEEIRFEEFVKYLLDPDTHEQSYEQHWARYNYLCQPCYVQYDFIGKMETMEKDVDEAFKYIGIQEEIKFPGRSVSYKNVKTSSIKESQFLQLSKTYLEKLWHYLKIDFQLFSYEKPKILSDVPNI